jgi:hypothetical protein
MNNLLGEQLKILAESDLNFSFEVTGFEMAEIYLFIERLSLVSEGAPDTVAGHIS